MQVWSRVIGGFVAAGLVMGGALAATPASAATAKQLGISKEYAPKGKKGAIILPYVYCPSGAPATATVRKAGSTKVVKVSWRRGLEYVNVSAGTYRVSIASTCGGSPTGAATVKVRKEKDGNTITRAEYKRIKEGMTLKQVKKIVGTRGIAWAGGNRYFDRRGDRNWAQVWLVKGRVGGKLWVAEQGDNGFR